MSAANSKDGQSIDLLVLKELIAKMGGIEIIEELSDAQIEAQGGGETLRAEVLHNFFRSNC